MRSALRTMICPHCHVEMETTGESCTECGARLNLKEVAASSAMRNPAQSVEDSYLPSDLTPSPATQLEAASSIMQPPGAVALDLTPEQWMHLLTALGHYAGVLQSLNMDKEREKVMETYRIVLKEAGKRTGT